MLTNTMSNNEVTHRKTQNATWFTHDEAPACFNREVKQFMILSTHIYV